MKKETVNQVAMPQVAQPYEARLGAHSPLTKAGPGAVIFSHLWWAHEHVFNQVFSGSSFCNVIDPKREGEVRYASSRRVSVWLSLSKLVHVCAALVTIAAARKRGREGQEGLKWCSRGVWCPRCLLSHAFLLITACLLTLAVCHSLTYSHVFSRKHHPGEGTMSGSGSQNIFAGTSWGFPESI